MQLSTPSATTRRRRPPAAPTRYTAPTRDARRGDTTPPRARRAWLRVLALAGTSAALLLVFLLAVRPWYRQWGATDAEARMPLPGDAIIPGAVRQETRAITIRARVDHVWPWLAQLGMDRGGFYSYDLIENLVGCEMPTVDVLRPEKQSWRLGDKLWMYPPDKADGMGFATLRAYVPGRALGFAARSTGTALDRPEDGSWSLVLVPLGDTATRLLTRDRGAAGRSLLGVAFDRSIFEPMHFVMERRMMLGIRDLAEGRDRGRLVNHAQVVLWTATFAMLVAAAAMVLLRRSWRRPLAGFVAAAVAFQLLTLRQPPLWIGVALVAAVGAALWWPTGRRSPRPLAVRGTP